MTHIIRAALHGAWTCGQCGAMFSPPTTPADHLLGCPGIDEGLRDDLLRKRAELAEMQTAAIAWVHDLHDRMVQLAALFPSFCDRIDRRELLGDGWSAKEIDKWACSGAVTSGSLHAARFLLAVWSGRAYDYPQRRPHTRVIRRFECGVFDVVAAMGSWDLWHRAAFNAWSRDPWWP